MKENKNHVLMREGSAYIDGVKVMEACVVDIYVTPELWEGRALKQKTKDRRWIGIDIKAKLSEYRSTPWLREKVKAYLASGDTPEITFQGIQDDENSAYHKTYGQDVVTLSGAVITSDIHLLNVDMDGEMVKDEIDLAAKNIA